MSNLNSVALTLTTCHKPVGEGENFVQRGGRERFLTLGKRDCQVRHWLKRLSHATCKFLAVLHGAQSLNGGDLRRVRKWASLAVVLSDSHRVNI
jgi:hypothetical protein